MLKINRKPELIEKDDMSFIDDHLEFWEEDKFDFDCEVSDSYQERIECNIGIKANEQKYIVDCIDYADKYQVERFKNVLQEIERDLKTKEIRSKNYDYDILTFYWRNETNDKLYIAKYETTYEYMEKTPPEDDLEFYICVTFDTFVENIDKQLKQIEDDIWAYKNQDRYAWVNSCEE